jgi:hypothetical protein
MSESLAETKIRCHIHGLDHDPENCSICYLTTRLAKAEKERDEALTELGKLRDILDRLPIDVDELIQENE